ncbi:hypothetical protein CDD83_5619 [Cordyceps sp. RAO-2017]|nr:hypothetical protein CDD83_5619 [Cordyceps sp. RAO-2017]
MLTPKQIHGEHGRGLHFSTGARRRNSGPRGSCPRRTRPWRTSSKADLRALSSSPLLSSIYAETLRLHVKSFTVVSSPVEDITLGKNMLPKYCIGLVNSHISHTDEQFWNTGDGQQPG